MKPILLLTLLALSAISAAAQTDEPGKNELMVWGGFAPVVRTFEPVGGRTWDAQYGMAALRYSHRFNNSDWLNIKYTVDVIPVAVLHYPDRVITQTGPNTVRVDRVKETKYAFGASPFGLQFNFRPKKKVQPFLGLSLSALVFNKTTPNDLGQRLNFGSEGGAGVEYRLSDKKALTFGYKFYHISNASRGEINPGYDAQMLYLGYTFWSK
ncbi:MAG: acyloxyacyl hydrolase [Pyrinomonadaceae bacterium]